MVHVGFVVAGAVLLRLRGRARSANECYDLELDPPGVVTPRRCCSSGSLCLEDDAEAKQEEPACKFCDETSACRFCFAGPERGELITPCDCVGSQEFVHLACLRQWQKVAMRTKGNPELDCRVCHARFRLPRRPLLARLKLWFSFKARDRLDAYSVAWAQTLARMCIAEKRLKARAGGALAAGRGGAKLKKFARVRSAAELALVLGNAEVTIWAGREVRQGKREMCSMSTLAWFATFVHQVGKLKKAGLVGR